MPFLFPIHAHYRVLFLFIFRPHTPISNTARPDMLPICSSPLCSTPMRPRMPYSILTMPCFPLVYFALRCSALFCVALPCFPLPFFTLLRYSLFYSPFFCSVLLCSALVCPVLPCFCPALFCSILLCFALPCAFDVSAHVLLCSALPPPPFPFLPRRWWPPPTFILRHGMDRNGKNPLCLYAYTSYGLYFVTASASTVCSALTRTSHGEVARSTALALSAVVQQIARGYSDVLLKRPVSGLYSHHSNTVSPYIRMVSRRENQSGPTNHVIQRLRQ